MTVCSALEKAAAGNCLLACRPLITVLVGHEGHEGWLRTMNEWADVHINDGLLSLTFPCGLGAADSALTLLKLPYSNPELLAQLSLALPLLPASTTFFFRFGIAMLEDIILTVQRRSRE